MDKISSETCVKKDQNNIANITNDHRESMEDICVQSKQDTSQDEIPNPLEEVNRFVCTLSREEIRENRKIKRKQKRNAVRLEKQKQREDKRYEEMANSKRTSKLKIIKEEELINYRRIEAEDRHDVNRMRENHKESFQISDDFFPELQQTSNILEASSFAPNSKTSQFLNVVKNVPIFERGKKHYPDLTGKRTKGSELSNSCTEDIVLLNAMEVLSGRRDNEATNVVQTHEISFGEEQEETDTNKRNSKKKDVFRTRRPKNSRVSNRPSYCINLLHTAKIQQRKNDRKKKSTNKLKVSPLQIEGNPLDSSKPMKMNKGKHYLRDEGVRKHKKKITRKKKIIYNYRKLKKEVGYQQDQLPNVLLNKEFLDLLTHHISLYFSFSSDCDRQILLYNFFTDKKRRNKLWDIMRDCIRNNIDKGKMKIDLVNKDENYVINDTFNETYCISKNEHIEDKSSVLIGENSVDEAPKTKNNDGIKNSNSDLEIRQNYNTIVSVTNTSKFGEEENVTKSAIMKNDEAMSQTFSSKKQRRIQKKMQKKLAVNLDETIVMNKSKTDGEAVNVAENKLDLVNIVDDVANKRNIQQLCSVKQQIHSRSFRPYCNQMPSPTLRKCSIDLMKQIVQFQKRLYKSDPLKGASKRRYLVGMNEARKVLPIKGKVKLLFVAPDLESVPISGGIEDDVQNLLTMATLQSVPYLFSVPRRTLGSVTFRAPSPVSCVAVLDYSGCEALVEQILPLIEEAKQEYDVRLKEALELNSNIDVPIT